MYIDERWPCKNNKPVCPKTVITWMWEICRPGVCPSKTCHSTATIANICLGPSLTLKVKSGMPREECMRGAFLRPWARRRINHWSLWHMASGMPDLRLPFQLHGITASWTIPNSTACANNLPNVLTWKRNGRDSNSRPSDFWVASPTP